MVLRQGKVLCQPLFFLFNLHLGGKEKGSEPYLVKLREVGECEVDPHNVHAQIQALAPVLAQHARERALRTRDDKSDVVSPTKEACDGAALPLSMGTL